MQSDAEWHSFAGSLLAPRMTVPGKNIHRILEGGRYLWHKHEHGYPRELPLHTLLGAAGGDRLPHVQQYVRFDKELHEIVTADAGRDVWTWLWHCARPPSGEQQVTVFRNCHPDARDHIFNWDDALLRFAAGALEALDSIHALGIVHFDLHLANWCLEALNPVPGAKTSDGLLLRCRMLLDRPNLIDFSESLWEDRMPLACVPRHVKIILDPATHEFAGAEHRMSPAFQRVAELAYDEALRHSAEFKAVTREVQWRWLTSRGWCTSAGLTGIIGRLLVEHLDWREDLFQLGYMLRKLMGETRDNITYGYNLGRQLGDPEVDGRVIAPLPSRAVISETDLTLRDRLERLTGELMGFACKPGAAGARPHEALATDIRLLLKAQGYDSHAPVEFRFVDRGRRQAASPAPHRAFRDTSDAWCPVLVKVPRGQYRIGPPTSLRTVALKEALAVGRDPVTVAEFAAFATDPSADQVRLRRWRLTSDRARHPMTGVTRAEADAYACWLTARVAKPRGWSAFRILTADEWEICCRAGGTGDYAFDRPMNDVSKSLAIYRWSERNKAGDRWPPGLNLVEPASIDSPGNRFNAFGLRGMHGNVWEIVSSVNNPSRSQLRGGCFASPPRELAAHFPVKIPAAHESEHTGFRICRTLEPDGSD